MKPKNMAKQNRVKGLSRNADNWISFRFDFGRTLTRIMLTDTSNVAREMNPNTRVAQANPIRG